MTVKREMFGATAPPEMERTWSAQAQPKRHRLRKSAPVSGLRLARGSKSPRCSPTPSGQTPLGKGGAPQIYGRGTACAVRPHICGAQTAPPGHKTTRTERPRIGRVVTGSGKQSAAESAADDCAAIVESGTKGTTISSGIVATVCESKLALHKKAAPSARVMLRRGRS